MKPGDRGALMDVPLALHPDQLEPLDALAADLTGGDRAELLRRIVDDWLRQRAERFVWHGPDEPGGPDFDLR